jgi:hypothetical protein
MQKKTVLILHSCKEQIKLLDFPVFYQTFDPDLRLVKNGGGVVDESGNDIFFTIHGTKKKLPHRIVHYDGCTGRLITRINFLSLQTNQEVKLDLYYGRKSPGELENPFTDCGDDIIFEYYDYIESKDHQHKIANTKLIFDDQITVEAWIHCDKQEVESIQPLVSLWRPLEDFGSIAGFDASNIDGLDSRGYFGAVFDGRYVYFSPQHYEGRLEHGVVLRLDTQGDFYDPTSYTAYNADGTDGLHTCGFYGAAFDGHYVYFVPRQDYSGYHSRVLRYDTNKPFNSVKSWEAFDVGYPFSKQGVVFDGQFLYFCPGFSGDVATEENYSAKVLRFDTLAEFKNPNSWQIFDASGTSRLEVGCFDGGGFDGCSIYFAPLMNGISLKYDTSLPFEDPTAWCAYDAKQNHQMGMCVGIVFDGKFMYYMPYGHGKVVRYNTLGYFQDPKSWQAFDVNEAGVLDSPGFDGGVFDGRYVYFIPFISKQQTSEIEFHSHLLRYDTLKPFDEPNSWDTKDTCRADGISTIGYNAGAYDGRFIYLAPWRDGTADGGIHGRILRIDTLGDQASFSLRAGDYGHNGGLCAAVIGPSFRVNSSNGHCYNAFVPQPMEEGWHYLVGVFNGKRICLFLDGIMIRSCEAAGQVMQASVPLEIGHMADGASDFTGDVVAVRVSKTARSEDWISAAYREFRAWMKDEKN